MRWIVFDIGEVLIRLQTDLMYQQLGECCNLHPNLIRQYFAESGRSFICGEQSELAFYAALRKICVEQNLPADLHPDDMCLSDALLREISEPVTEMVQVLERLEGHCPLACFSNTNAVHWRYIMNNYPFMKYFQQIFASHEIGAMKPELEAYLYVSRALNTEPENIIFIDDKEENIRGARKAGWAAIRYQSAEICEHLLNQML